MSSVNAILGVIHAIQKTQLRKQAYQSLVIRWDASPLGVGIDEKVCDLCRDLNNTYYHTDDMIPERPHPNCRCALQMRIYIEDPAAPYGRALVSDIWEDPPDWGEGPVLASDYLM
jgi:hypothetical protein